MVRLGLGRDGCVLAFGGGATLDLAGFLAATYARGVPWVALPTTLLSMVDAAIGGKTAVNTPHGKNLVGAFHQPSSVLCDVGYLATLPDREVRSGLAEVAKTALLEGEERLSWVEENARRLTGRDPEALEEGVLFCVAYKAGIVEADELETGRRRILNLGHTLGHGIEAASGYALRHGEAVALGLIAEARLAELEGVAEAGFAQRVEALVEALGLPVRLPPDVTPRGVVPYLSRDKKTEAGRPRFVLLEAAGRVHDERGIPVPDTRVVEALERLAG
jgi:3-dehydroquinate synthase